MSRKKEKLTVPKVRQVRWELFLRDIDYQHARITWINACGEMVALQMFQQGHLEDRHLIHGMVSAARDYTHFARVRHQGLTNSFLGLSDSFRDPQPMHVYRPRWQGRLVVCKEVSPRSFLVQLPDPLISLFNLIFIQQREIRSPLIKRLLPFPPQPIPLPLFRERLVPEQVRPGDDRVSRAARKWRGAGRRCRSGEMRRTALRPLRRLGRYRLHVAGLLRLGGLRRDRLYVAGALFEGRGRGAEVVPAFAEEIEVGVESYGSG